MLTPAHIDPRRTAILVMDYQAAILGFLHDSDPLLDTVAQAIALIRQRGGCVGYVRVAFEDGDYEAFPAHSAMGGRIKAAGPNMHADSPKTAVDARVAPEPGDILVRKTRVGAFSTTDLHDQLTRAGIDTLVLVGVHTSGVVLSTVREAHDLDYRVIVVADGCADPDPQVHTFLINSIFPKQGMVIALSELAGMLA